MFVSINLNSQAVILTTYDKLVNMKFNKKYYNQLQITGQNSNSKQSSLVHIIFKINIINGLKKHTDKINNFHR